MKSPVSETDNKADVFQIMKTGINVLVTKLKPRRN